MLPVTYLTYKVWDGASAAPLKRACGCSVALFSSLPSAAFPSVTVEDITEAADVGKGTFFNYFESKDHVLGVMAEIQLGKVREAVTLAESGTETIHSVLHRLFLRVGEEPGRSPRPRPRPDLLFFRERARSWPH